MAWRNSTRQSGHTLHVLYAHLNTNKTHYRRRNTRSTWDVEEQPCTRACTAFITREAMLICTGLPELLSKGRNPSNNDPNPTAFGLMRSGRDATASTSLVDAKFECMRTGAGIPASCTTPHNQQDNLGCKGFCNHKRARATSQAYINNTRGQGAK